MKKIWTILAYGIILWLIPFIVSMFLFDKTGKTVIDFMLFKSIMIVVSAAVSAILIVIYFRTVGSNFLREGIVIGLVWLVINLIFDIVILMPMSRMTIGTYFTQIGLRYLMIPIWTTAVGWVSQQKILSKGQDK